MCNKENPRGSGRAESMHFDLLMTLIFYQKKKEDQLHWCWRFNEYKWKVTESKLEVQAKLLQ
jgi:hypothetical protein